MRSHLSCFFRGYSTAIYMGPKKVVTVLSTNDRIICTANVTFLFSYLHVRLFSLLFVPSGGQALPHPPVGTHPSGNHRRVRGALPSPRQGSAGKSVFVLCRGSMGVRCHPYFYFNGIMEACTHPGIKSRFGHRQTPASLYYYCTLKYCSKDVSQTRRLHTCTRPCASDVKHTHEKNNHEILSSSEPNSKTTEVHATAAKWRRLVTKQAPMLATFY